MTILDDVREAHKLLNHLRNKGLLDNLAPAALEQALALVDRLGDALTNTSFPDNDPIIRDRFQGNTVGINANLSAVYSGFDDVEIEDGMWWSPKGDGGSGDYVKITRDERAQIAGHMIARWLAWSNMEAP